MHYADIPAMKYYTWLGDATCPLTTFWVLKLIYWQQTEEEDFENYKRQIINVLQDIMEIITQDVMFNGHA